MEEIAVMNPIGMVTNDEMSDESISLDLHVSDTDESEECNVKRSDGEDKIFNRRISAESEDDILNKYVTDSPPLPSADLESKIEDDSLFPNENDVLLPKNLESDLEEIPPTSKECDEDYGVLLKNERQSPQNIICNGDDNDVIMKELEESEDLLGGETTDKATQEGAVIKNENENETADAVLSETLEIEKSDVVCNGFEASEEEEEDDKDNQPLTTLLANSEDAESHKNNKQRNNGAAKDLMSIELNCETKTDKVCNGEVDELSSDSVEKDNSEIHTSSDDKPSQTNSDGEKQREEKPEETEDNEDLLQVMDEQSVDDAEQEIKDDHSCSSSEKDDESGDNPEELSRDNHEELSRDNHEELSRDNHEELSRDNHEELSRDNHEELSRDNHEELSTDNHEELSRDNHEEVSTDNNDELRENHEESPAETNDEPRENNEEESVDNEEIKDAVLNGPVVDENDDNHESQIDTDMEEGECPMDIEENDIGTIFVDQSKRPEGLQRENSVNIDIEDNSLSQHDKEANKENEGAAENKENEEPKEAERKGPVRTSDVDTANNIVTNLICDDVEMDIENDSKEILDKTVTEEIKKSNKRQLSDDFPDEGDSSKKMRIEEPTQEEEQEEKKKEAEKYTVTRLNNFKQFMLDKKLKKLTRFELEELCMQKMCECIINKSEIGELRQKIKVQEQAIDTWRKEAVVVAKQTRDLKIVHERLIADLKVMKEQTGKPLVPVKITRSVGLQAIIENTTRTRPVVNGVTTPQRTTPVTTPTKTVTTTTRQPIKKPVLQRTMSKPLQTVGQNDGGATTPKLRQVQTLHPKKNAEPKAVIDLTDEDEKNQTSQTSTPTNTASPTVRIINKPNTNNVVSNNNNTSPKITTNIVTSSSPKIMIMSPSVLARPGGTVMLKVNSNNLVSSANGIIPAVQNGVSVVSTQPLVRSVQQIRVPISSTSTVRTATPVKTIYKHPAPLPAPPAMQQNIVAKKPIPPRPHLNLTRSNCGTGIVLQWKMPYKLDMYESIVSYQLYAYQETKSPPRTDNWGKIGDVKALDLPMAVTLTQFAVGNRYFFAVRAVDVQKRLGPFSDPQTILL